MAATAAGHRARAGRPDAVERFWQAVHTFTAAERRLRGRHQRHGESLGIGHLRAMFFLVTATQATAGRLAREAELNPASVTSMVDQLEARGLVERRRDDHDRRVSWISLTPLGRAEVADKQARWNQRLAHAFADFSDEELLTAGRVLERLAALYDATEGDAPEDPP